MAWSHQFDGLPVLQGHVQSVNIGDIVYSFNCGPECERERKKQQEHRMKVVIFNLSNYSCSCLDQVIGPRKVSEPLEDFFAAAHNENVYIGGEKDGCFSGKALLCFDTISQQWSCVETTGDIPRGRILGNVCVVGDSMYLFIRKSILYNQSNEESLYRLNLRSHTWKCMCKTNWYKKILTYDFVAIGSRLYILVATQNRQLLEHFGYFETDSEQWVDLSSSLPRYSRGVVMSMNLFVYKECIYFLLDYLHFNLRIEEQGSFYYILRYSAKTNQWNDVPTGNPPQFLYFNSVVVFGDKVFCFKFPNGTMEVLEFSPSLKTLSFLAIRKYKVPTEALPKILQDEHRLYAQKSTDLDPVKVFKFWTYNRRLKDTAGRMY